MHGFHHVADRSLQPTLGVVTRRAASGARHDVELEGARAAEAFASGVRTSLRNNATAYGFSISITAAFGLVSTVHPSSPIAVPVLLFAAAAALTFFVVEALASRLFQRVGSTDQPRVVFIGGAVDGLSVLCAVGAAVGLSRIPGTLAWPVTAAGTVLVFLLVGGLDILIARHLARHTDRVNG